jgi:hypothetical protein
MQVHGIPYFLTKFIDTLVIYSPGPDAAFSCIIDNFSQVRRFGVAGCSAT